MHGKNEIPQDFICFMLVQVHFGVSDFTAEELVFSCRAPLTHPYMAARLAELVQLPAAPPLEQRKVVLYFSRNTDALGNRGVRKVGKGWAVLSRVSTQTYPDSTHGD